MKPHWGQSPLRFIKETLELLSVMGDDHRFIDAYNERKGKSAEGGIHTMSDALNTIIGRETEKAEKKAREDERRTIAISLKEGGMSAEEIAKTFKCQVDVVEKWLTPSAV